MTRSDPAGRPRPASTALLLPAALLLATAACAGDNAGADGDSPAPIKVGAIFDLTGPTADVGTDYADGMRGFVDWANARGGIEGRPIDLVYQDYAYQVGPGRAALQPVRERGRGGVHGMGGRATRRP